MSRHALITGVSSGIGAATADKLLEEGWRVTGLSRTLVKRDSDAFVSLSVDLFDTAALKRALVSLPPVDAVIHAAGMMKAAPLGDLDEETSEKLWQLHIRVAEVLANQLAPQLPTGGRIVLIGSRTSTGAAGRSQYVSTKSAMKGMVRSWAAELAPRGITANIVAPGATATPMLSQPGRESSPPKMPPIGRYIQPEEVAALVGYLLSPAADAITGQELVICGGGSL
ncbi:NAD(P)-dependent dehydrogenase (short-subunit alcohol dehydrogenase family) [Erwinia persicina]|jgi:NAD(P)-dependent dehydrogenase (short-subunit alcohol dehydrogenase family)|uniref:SDR family NAD(P)-dependent oxidoreductase n=2 Tax=Erwinia TaxID=551 RepID=A0ABV4E7F5_9GAMM|nr:MULTISPECIES: SDR family oxidoreductase [Erwinia]MCP1438113.1 NAD(P)-dependent dehydrogenase (short-subunit alcohol dehydrogenase family) [Erwinia persicina]MDN8543083.1 SDR family oxidoreductase [Erwinia sp. BC051422]